MVSHGIDISNWQRGIDLSSFNIDFCICKLSEGINFKDKSFEHFKEQIDKLKIPFGFYHFARENNPREEARWFYEYSKSFYMDGIPILDYETENDNNAYWCEQFMNEYHALTGKWCVLYISAYRCSQYSTSWLPDCCKLWIAGYPTPQYTTWIDKYPPYDSAPWKEADIWQFTSTLQIASNIQVDANLCYTNIFGKKDDTNYTNIDNVVFDVIKGAYGNGLSRRENLRNAGFDYNTVQRRVNEYFNIANKIMNGDFGNGEERKEKLAQTTYRYDIAQFIVNQFLT